MMYNQMTKHSVVNRYLTHVINNWYSYSKSLWTKQNQIVWMINELLIWFKIKITNNCFIFLGW